MATCPRTRNTRNEDVLIASGVANRLFQKSKNNSLTLLLPLSFFLSFCSPHSSRPLCGTVHPFPVTFVP